MTPTLDFQLDIRGQRQPIVCLQSWNGNLGDVQWLFEIRRVKNVSSPIYPGLWLEKI